MTYHSKNKYPRFILLITGLLFLAACKSTDPSSMPSETIWETDFTLPSFVFNLSLTISEQADGQLKAIVNSPEEKGFNKTATAVRFQKHQLRLSIPALAIHFKGTLDPSGNTLTGLWIRGRNARKIVFQPASSESNDGIKGKWQGQLLFPEKAAQFTIRFQKKWTGQLRGTLESSSLSLKHVPLEEVSFKGKHVYFQSSLLNSVYEGILDDTRQQMSGNWHWQRNNLLVPLTFSRVSSQPAARYQLPEQRNDGWSIASLPDAHLAAGPITEMFSRIGKAPYADIHSILLVKDNKLVIDHYSEGYNQNILHPLHGVSRGITSLLIGIASEQGMLPKLNAPLIRFFPEYAPFQHLDTQKQGIQLAHLLTMTSGFPCNDWSKTAMVNEKKLFQSNDWIQSILNLPLSHKPGSHWSDCSGNAILLGGVLAHASGSTVPEFAETHLFAPLGIQDYEWQFSPEGQPNTSSGLLMRPRDLAKIGALLLNNGRWLEQEIVAPGWIKQLTTPHVKNLNDRSGQAYGYLWWIKQLEFNGSSLQSYYVAGNGGQYLFCIPALNLAAVFTSGYTRDTDFSQPITLLQNYILKALQNAAAPQ